MTPFSFPHSLFFIRHGETDWNAEGRLQGQIDIPLNARGRIQAAAAARRLARLGRRFGQAADGLDFIASPLSRCTETMDIARGVLGLPISGYRTDPRWQELSFGDWEGLTWPEIQQTEAGRVIDREASLWDFLPPNGESYERMARRIAAALEAISRDTVLVGHGGVARLLMFLIGGMVRERALRSTISQGRVLVLQNGACRWV